MKNKKTILAVLIIGILLNVLTIFHTPKSASQSIVFGYEATADITGNLQVYYSADGEFGEDKQKTIYYGTAGETQIMKFTIGNAPQQLRLDFIEFPSTMTIKNLFFEYRGERVEIDTFAFYELIQPDTMQDLAIELVDSQEIAVTIDGRDPYFALDITSFKISDFAADIQARVDLPKKIAVCLVVDLILLVLIKYAEHFSAFLLEIYRNKKLIFRLSKNDFKTKFAGSYLGIVWAFIQPIVTVVVYWFVFQVGLRSGNVGKFPFVLWLVAGLIPWFFFSDALNSGTNAFLEYNYLVKKVVFKISIIPVVKVISALFVHLFFIAFTLVLYSFYGYYPDLYTLQVFYYTFCTFVLVLGISYATSAVVVFFRDLTQIISIVLQVGVWITPIMWNIYSTLPEKFIWIFKLNPLYYIVFGYRGALIDKTWFWEDFYLTAYFWIVTAALFGIGALLFRRLKVHFADVL